MPGDDATLSVGGQRVDDLSHEATIVRPLPVHFLELSQTFNKYVIGVLHRICSLFVCEEAVSRNQAMVSSLVLVSLASVTQAQEPSSMSGLDEVVVTDTIPLNDEAKKLNKIRVLSTAPLLAETLSRISTGDSVMSLFADS